MIRAWAVVFVLACVLCAGCHADITGGTTPTPTPSSSPTAPPANCETPAPSATNVTLVAMGSSVTATTDPTYGAINGYAPWPGQGSANVPTVAATIPLFVGDIVQFVNVDTDPSGFIVHSAVGFPNVSNFPPTPYIFPSPAASPVGTAISRTQLWSTGDIAPVDSNAGATSGYCYSQTFAVPAAGTFFFGDRSYYNLSGNRDVIVVSP